MIILIRMASNKEKNDLLKGDIKQDMTKAKALGSLFRSINTDLGYLNIPLLVANLALNPEVLITFLLRPFRVCFVIIVFNNLLDY